MIIITKHPLLYNFFALLNFKFILFVISDMWHDFPIILSIFCSFDCAYKNVVFIFFFWCGQSVTKFQLFSLILSLFHENHFYFNSTIEYPKFRCDIVWFENASNFEWNKKTQKMYKTNNREKERGILFYFDWKMVLCDGMNFCFRHQFGEKFDSDSENNNRIWFTVDVFSCVNVCNIDLSKHLMRVWCIKTASSDCLCTAS